MDGRDAIDLPLDNPETASTLVDSEVNKEIAPVQEAEEEPVIITKKKRKKRKDVCSDEEEKEEKKAPRKRRSGAARFVDDETAEEKKKKKKKKDPKSPVKLRHMMQDGQLELDRLLELWHPVESRTHAELTLVELLGFAQAFKWAYTAEEEDKKTGWDAAKRVFWAWWSKPMFHPDNDTFKDECECEVAATCPHKKTKDLSKQWQDAFDVAIPSRQAVKAVRERVRVKMTALEITMDPGVDDKDLAGLALKYLSETFIMVDSDGSSIVWEPTQKLWIHRKKDRSAVALGKQLLQLHQEKKVVFSDPKVEEKFTRRCGSSNVHNILGWLKGEIPVFPPPVTLLINRATWQIALFGGMVLDLQKLEVRERNPRDLFTIETNFEWMEDYVSEGIVIMDSKKLKRLKDLVSEGGERIEEQHVAELYKLLRELCPNAFKFTNGPFRDKYRHWPVLLHLGLLQSTHCIRKAIWVYGDGKGLKSTVFAAIVNSLGPYAVPLAKKVLFASGAESGHNTDLMRSENKRLIFIDELEKKDVLRETYYKLLVSHQQISAREIYGGQGEIKPMGTVLIGTNTVPPMEFSDCSIPDRILAIRATTRVFSRLEPPHQLPPQWEGVQTWQDGIDPEKRSPFFWVLKTPEDVKWSDRFLVAEDQGGYRNELGCLLALAGHIACKIISDIGEIPLGDLLMEDQQLFFREADHVGQYLADCTERDEKQTSYFKTVFQDYKVWCSEQGVKAGDQKSLTASLQSKGLMATEKRRDKGSKGGGTIKSVKVRLNSNKAD